MYNCDIFTESIVAETHTRFKTFHTGCNINYHLYPVDKPARTSLLEITRSGLLSYGSRVSWSLALVSGQPFRILAQPLQANPFSNENMSTGGVRSGMFKAMGCQWLEWRVLLKVVHDSMHYQGESALAIDLIGVSWPRFCTVRLYWVGDNLGWWDVSD